MIERLKSFSGNQKWIEILFTLLVLSFPFGSFFLSFSVGFMTIYPYLVLVALLAFLSFFMPKERPVGITRFYLLFVLFLFLYACAFLPFVAGKSYAVTDLRSIALMLMTTWVFIAVRQLFGFEKWSRVILFSFKLLFAVITLFALFEMMTGWHLEGAFTDKIGDRGLRDQLMFMPVFLWDNPNNFMVYLLLISTVILLLEPAGKQKDYLVAVILAIPFVFSVFVEARAAQVVLVLIALMYYGNRAGQQSWFKNRQAIYYVLFVSGAVAYAVLTNELFTEFPRSKERKVSYVVPVYPAPASVSYMTSKLAQPEIASADSIDMMDFRHLGNERLVLIKNGIDFTKESYFLGIGPGQYRYRHDNGQINHFAFGNNGAHFWLVELVSQFGIVNLGLYLAALGWIFFGALKMFRKERDVGMGLLIGLLALAAASIFPSAFLILDINWIFTVILVICAAELFSKKRVQ